MDKSKHTSQTETLDSFVELDFFDPPKVVRRRKTRSDKGVPRSSEFEHLPGQTDLFIERDRKTNNVDSRPKINHLELCAGGGMLGFGLSVVEPGLRTVCYVEREVEAAALLATRMENEELDAAPIWSDVRTFDASAWRGCVDIVSAGFPCQDLSVAGLRRGLDGERSGLFFDVLRIATDCDARWIFLENVPGIFSAGASIVCEGEQRQFIAASVVGAVLAEAGYDSWWLSLRASDVGASCSRDRWYCLALAGSHSMRQRKHKGLVAYERRWALDPSKAMDLFALPPSEMDAWREVIRQHPDLEPAIRRDADGLADRVERLRLLGNGVCPLQVAVAYKILSTNALVKAVTT